jgi:hypothetical protein
MFSSMVKSISFNLIFGNCFLSIYNLIFLLYLSQFIAFQLFQQHFDAACRAGHALVIRLRTYHDDDWDQTLLGLLPVVKMAYDNAG